MKLVKFEAPVIPENLTIPKSILPDHFRKEFQDMDFRGQWDNYRFKPGFQSITQINSIGYPVGGLVCAACMALDLKNDRVAYDALIKMSNHYLQQERFYFFMDEVPALLRGFVMNLLREDNQFSEDELDLNYVNLRFHYFKGMYISAIA
jgi:hypothetical protein